MLFISLILALAYWSPITLGAALNQQPLDLSNLGTPDGYQVALDELREVVGDSLFSPSPLAKPCYDPLNEELCDIVNKSKTNDVWVSNQPGGYFYVSTQPATFM